MILAALLAALSATLPPAPRCASGHLRVNYSCRWPMGRLAGGWARCGWVVAHAKGRHCEQHEREFWRRARACPLPVWTLQRRRGGCCRERVRYRTPSACARTHKRSAHCPPARGRDKTAGDGPDRTERTAASFPRQERRGRPSLLARLLAGLEEETALFFAPPRPARPSFPSLSLSPFDALSTRPPAAWSGGIGGRGRKWAPAARRERQPLPPFRAICHAHARRRPACDGHPARHPHAVPDVGVELLAPYLDRAGIGRPRPAGAQRRLRRGRASLCSPAISRALSLLFFCSLSLSHSPPLLSLTATGRSGYWSA